MKSKLMTLMLFLGLSSAGFAQTKGFRLWHFDKSQGYWVETVPLDSAKAISVPEVKAISNEKASVDGNEKKHYAVFSIHTNALYDVFLAPHIGCELALCDDWSVGADMWLAWLRHQENDLWWQNYGFDLYGRYWFGNGHSARDYQGWHAGIYAGTFTYDVWNDGKGYQSPDMFNTYRTGAEVGWATIIGKNWRVDLYGGTGLLHTKQKVYHRNFGGGYYVSEERCRNLVDLTRFGVTISYVLK